MFLAFNVAFMNYCYKTRNIKVCILKLGARHTIFCVQELLVCWEITLYFAFIWAGVPEKPDRVKGAIYSTVELSE